MVAAPIGYERPSFPSLFWPLGKDSNDFHSSFLYSTKDIWEFTTIWTIIFMTGVYTASAGIFLITHYIRSYRHPAIRREFEDSEDIENDIELHNMNYNHLYKTKISTYQHYFVNSIFVGNTKMHIFTILAYIFVGAFQGFVAGSVVGVLIAAIYDSAQFKVTTWIPFVYALIITLYNISDSYSFTVKNL
ncbi:hypothetical protein C6P40_005139 [Pichia californica]|uniref:Uncharacterized protein n=1 Tax=Pichia californica TaxID=460514 RepID=A0A9P7BGL5_9ASCO|nr:hypothetical protein C6P42_001738 [[Candida] californica]KAG0689360.1 hypothetical protein C6P40_005139 [[Candida] californica]